MRQLIKECDAEGMTFGIPAFIDNRVMGIGTEVELVSIEKTFDSGEMDIKTKGIGVYKIEEFYDKAPGKLYAGADIKRLEIDGSTDISMANDVLDYLEELYQILEIKKEIPKDVSELNTYDLAHHIGCNIEQEYEILTIPDEYGRLKFIYQHLQNLLPIVQETEMLRKKAQMNGHFKNILPPEF